MDIKEAIGHLLEGQSLDKEEMTAVMRQIMTGLATDAQIAGFLVALRMKGETVDEISGAATVMRELATPVTVSANRLVDIVGTGGDGASIFNVSTACTFVVAAAGGHVAKHGNRSVSSSSGSADVLEAAGVRLDIDADAVARCVESLGVGFMFALNHHSAMKHAIGPRKELGVRTVFNLLGPLTNPAGVKHQLLGVYHRHWLKPMAKVMRDLGSKHVLVVCSQDGLDEISTATETYVAELNDGVITEYTISPELYGMDISPIDSLKVENAQQSFELIKRVLKGESGPASDIVALNSGAALYAADIAETLTEGVSMAQDILSSGQAAEKLSALAEMTTMIKAAEAE